MNTFLNKDEMIRLTGYKRPKEQKQQLTKVGIPYTLDKSGKPVVYKEAQSKRRPIEQIEPNWSR